MEATKYMEGWVEKKANKWRKYYAVVLGKRIYFFKNDKTDVTENMVGHLEISGPDVVKPEETKKKYAIFSVTAQTGIYQIKLPSEALRDEWVEAIKRAGYAAQGDSPQGTGGGGGGGPPPVPGNHPGMGKRMPSSGSMGGRALPPPPTDASPQVDTTPDVGPDGEPPFVAFPPDGSPFSDASWHFGRAPRKVCENLLKRHGSEGSFILGTSESNPGNYSLSVMDSDAPRHYKVTPQPGGGYILTGCAETIFDDLGKLVEYYITASKGRSHPLDKNAIAKLEIAFSGPSKVVQGAVLPGMMMAMQMEAEQAAARGHR